MQLFERIGRQIDRFISWLYIYRLWGSRCSDFDKDCPTCQHWKEHDECFNFDVWLCDSCGQNPADFPSKLCVGCEAYKDHTR